MPGNELAEFNLNPLKGSYISSFGPKGTGKSELNTRFLISYPYNGLLMDLTGDVDPNHEFSQPLTPALHSLAGELAQMDEPSLDSMFDFQKRVREAWTQNGELKYAKYRLEPSYLSKNWLEQSDAYVGLAYLRGYTFIMLDEIGDEAPAQRTPRWTRQALRVGRHEGLSLGMAGPRPKNIDPNVLNQADLVSVHGQLHPNDVDTMAQHLHLSTKQLGELIQELYREDRDGVEVCSYLVYVRRTNEIILLPPLPPRS